MCGRLGCGHDVPGHGVPGHGVPGHGDTWHSDGMTFDGMWSAIEPVGRDARTGGYRRYAWTEHDAALREWFAGEAAARGLDLVTDRAGNQWAWWGDPDTAVAAGRPGVVIGSHLDSVPDGGAFDGPLGVVSALAVVDALKAKGFVPSRPIAVANFVDEEGARFRHRVCRVPTDHRNAGR